MEIYGWNEEVRAKEINIAGARETVSLKYIKILFKPLKNLTKYYKI